MLKSMTGFGKATKSSNNKTVIVEIRSLNSKLLDLSIKSPVLFREKESEMKNIISKKLVRGKVDLQITIEYTGEEAPTEINKNLVKNYYKQLSEIAKDLNISISESSLQAIIRMPDVITTPNLELKKEDVELLYSTLDEALNKIDEFRTQEGAITEKDLKTNILNIEQLLKQVEEPEKLRVEKIKNRIRTNIEELIDKSKIDENRFEQELIFYIEKFDVSEEKVRLANHCKYFLETLQSKDAQGKKLGFISQEIGREINTLGSKANDAVIQKIVIQMKDNLEKIKEQTLNIL
jgi:uncharacterized protein (TIGR00255 family)